MLEDLAGGLILHGRYRIERRLGGGGMGSVYLASDVTRNLRVAIKQLVPKPRPAEQQAAILRQFTLEAEILKGLCHARLPAVHDFFESDGKHYLVMDYVDGENLDATLKLHGRLPERHVIRIGRQLCEVLWYLHQQSPPIVFRDLKPSNIMLDASGVRLVDFGIAKVLDLETGEGTLTAVHEAGSVGFAAPEQYGGRSDARTDIYALGATLFTLLTGDRLPHAIVMCSPGIEVTPLRERIPDLQPAVADLIVSMLQPRPQDRPQTVDRVAVALMQALEFAPATIKPLHGEDPALSEVRATATHTATTIPVVSDETAVLLPAHRRPYWVAGVLVAVMVTVLAWPRPAPGPPSSPPPPPPLAPAPVAAVRPLPPPSPHKHRMAHHKRVVHRPRPVAVHRPAPLPPPPYHPPAQRPVIQGRPAW